MGKEDYVQTGVILMCDKGVIPTPFIATPKRQNHHSITGGTIRDNIPLLNIISFGICTSTRYVCVPVFPAWENYPRKPYFIEGYQPLVLSSQARCKVGGTIRIYTSYMEALAAMKDMSKSWKETLVSMLNKSIGEAVLGPLGSKVLELCGKGDFVEGVGSGVLKGLGSTVEGLYNMVAHPLDTLGGMATLAGVAIVGYGGPLPLMVVDTPQERLQRFDKLLGTNLAAVDAGIKQSLSESWDTLLQGSDFEKGEIVGQAVEFVAEIAVGTKGTGAVMKSVKAGSMGSRMAKVAGIVDKVNDVIKATGGKLKNWTLGKLKNAWKGIFGKKKSLSELSENAIKKQKAKQLKTNKNSGTNREIEVKDELIKEGHEVKGSQVSVKTKFTRRIVDHLIKEKGTGKIKAVEVKRGKATRNSMQVIKDRFRYEI